MSIRHRRPPIRIIHHFACTGGSVITRCLAALPNTRVLSEVDPLSTIELSSSLFRPTDLIGLAVQGTHSAEPNLRVAMFRAALAELFNDSRLRGLDLVLRDHAHSHFCVDTCSFERPTLRELVAEVADVVELVTVRDPLESFMALEHNGWIHFSPSTLTEYTNRYHAFLDRHGGAPVMRYEDFTISPESWMCEASKHLHLAFNPLCTSLFPAVSASGDSGRRGDRISPRPPRSVPKKLLAEASAIPNLSDLLNRLGYSNVFST